jgi:Ca2+-binding RTX toxin-like protein
LYGKDGDDLLHGGKGRDFLVGGAGSDSFIFDLSDADGYFDTIRDFNAEEDHILLTGYEADAEVTVIQLGKHAVIFVENEHIAMLQRTDADALVVDATILFGDIPMP